jgi:hypothetical protein
MELTENALKRFRVFLFRNGTSVWNTDLYRAQMNACSVQSLLAYGRTGSSAVIWMVLGRRISDQPRV